MTPATRQICGCLLLLATLTACQPGSTQEPEAKPCERLDRLIGHIEAFQETAAVTAAANRNQAEPLIETIIATLDSNQQQSPGECSYLNEEAHPTHIRFEFVDQLTQWTIRDTQPSGIYHLIELRGIFSDDAAISEFFSEEIARVALENPSCYLGYFQTHPNQQQYLLNSTKWSLPDLPRLIQGFEAIDPQGQVHAFLLSLSGRQNPSLP